ncbi:MAG: glycosyltransferase [Panacibacter sp.]
MRIINLIKDVNPIRMGVFSAAISTAPFLYKNHNATSELWFPGSDYNQDFPSIQTVSLKDTGISNLKELIQSRNLDPQNDIIVTHSPWSFQSIWGKYLAAQGFKWVFVPHSNLAPWGLSQKWLKKKIYLALVEKRRLSKADVIRALSVPEKEFLARMFPGKEIIVMPTGINMPPVTEKLQNVTPKIFLFMARLHFVKNIIPLVNGWIASSLQNNSGYKLVIAGPDDGELEKLQPLLTQSNNIEYIGPIYKVVKEVWLKKSTFFILPSTSEGFSVSLVEAAARGLIPIITEGCNFPELLQKKLAIETGTTAGSIKMALEKCMNLNNSEIQKLGDETQQFMQNHYNNELIAARQFELYSRLLKSK